LQRLEAEPIFAFAMNVTAMTRNLVRPASATGDARLRLPVKPAPGRKPMTPEERHADMMRRFPRTMAYLAEH
jgi:hypothetical protein